MDLIDRSINLGLGALTFTREKVESFVNDLVKRGQVQREEAARVIDDLIERGKKEKEQLRDFIDRETERVLSKMNLATKEDVEQLKARLNELESKLSER